MPDDVLDSPCLYAPFPKFFQTRDDQIERSFFIILSDHVDIDSPFFKKLLGHVPPFYRFPARVHFPKVLYLLLGSFTLPAFFKDRESAKRAPDTQMFHHDQLLCEGMY